MFRAYSFIERLDVYLYQNLKIKSLRTVKKLFHLEPINYGTKQRN